jgi:SNF2 family DNA or RNA helicase
LTPPKPFTPRPYGNAATDFLLENNRAALFMEPGLGKTISTLNAIHFLLECGMQSDVLIIAPIHVARNTWIDECRKWEHTFNLQVAIMVGSPKERLAALKSPAQIKTINYENLPWLVETLGDEWPFGTVVFDESSKLKSFRAHYRTSKTGKQTLVATAGTRAGAIVKQCFKQTERVWLLTGTPSANSLSALWPQMFFIDDGKRLGKSFSAFEDRWYKTGYNGYDKILLPNAEKEIREAIADKVFTLRAEDYLDLGEEIVNNVYVDLPPSARSLYDDMEKKFYVKIKEKEIEAFTAATKSGKLHQLANGGIYYDDKGSWEHTHDAKLDALESIIEEACGMPVIVVYTFQSDKARILNHFKQAKAFDTNSKTIYNSFLKGEVPILLIHPASAGHGINQLETVTNKIVFFSVDWDQELRQQVIARIGPVRQKQSGFDRPTFVYNILAHDTIDEIILDRLESKKSVEEALKEGLARKYLK